MIKTHLFISNFENKDARRLFFRVLLFIPIVLLVVITNFYIDPMGLYRTTAGQHDSDEYQIAQALAEGKNVELLRENIDYRLVQKYFVENMTVAPDIAILGSSHSMWVGDNIFSNKKVINNSVLAAVLPDYLGIMEWYAEKDLFPKRVIIMLDPLLIVSPLASERWVSIKDDTYGMLERLGVHSGKLKAPAVSQAWLNVFSFSYFQKSVNALLHESSSQAYRVTDADTGDFLILKDGRCLLGFYTKDPEKNKRKAIREIEHGAYLQHLNQKKPDKELEDILEDFIRYLMGHHVRVTLCLLPFHPDLYKTFLESQKRPGAADIFSFENYYAGLAQKLGLEITGSYDPAACNLVDKDFYDADHISNNAIEKMFKQKNSKCFMPGV